MAEKDSKGKWFVCEETRSLCKLWRFKAILFSVKCSQQNFCANISRGPFGMTVELQELLNSYPWLCEDHSHSGLSWGYKEAIFTTTFGSHLFLDPFHRTRTFFRNRKQTISSTKCVLCWGSFAKSIRVVSILYWILLTTWITQLN